jgi:hypothetical protein
MDTREVSEAECSDDTDELVSSAMTEERPFPLAELLLPDAVGMFVMPWMLRRCFVRSPAKEKMRKMKTNEKNGKCGK